MIRACKRSVGRPREFDEETALDAAMGAFWNKGYEATSLRDLCECTGLHKGSLYQTFGDKKSLFMRSLKNYEDKEFRKVADRAFQSASPLENIRSLAYHVCSDAAQGQGCLMVNSMVELAPHDAEVQAFISEFAERRLRAMSELIQKARNMGEIKIELPSDLLARQLMITLSGAAAMVKGVLDLDQALAVVDSIIDGWT